MFQHESVEKLRRELARNGQLRELCGFNEQVPSPWAYTRFLKALMKQEKLIDEMFDKMVKQLSEMLPDFGKNLAMDSKAISSFAKHKNKKGERDGRRDTDADYGRKEYRGVYENGKAWEKIVKWFGYKLHLIVDATYELPIIF
ncbi:transposase, partial [Carboxydocella sp. ULO1]